MFGYKESGNSMTPIIKHREPVDIYPVDVRLLTPGDVVVSRVAGRIYTHLVKAVEGHRVQIGNNHGKINGWTTRDKVYGIVVRVDGRELSGAKDKIRR